MRNNKIISVLISLVCYILAVGIGYLAFISINLDLHFLLKLLVADIIATIFIFFCSLSFNNSSLYDPYWSVKPMVFAIFYMIDLGIENSTLIHWVTFIMVQLYGLRLTTNFYRDWPGLIHEDWRYVNFRNQFPKAYWLVSLSGIHLFPTIMVYLSCLPMYAIFKINASQSAHPIILLFGGFVLIVSIILAFVADEQMRIFRNKAENKGKFMNEGLWKTSRHPNYLGEILSWWGLYFIMLSYGFEYWYLGVGALAINIMFLFVSIPLLDKRSLERREGFDKYMEETNKLLLFPKF